MLTESFVCSTVSSTGADQEKSSTSTHGLFEHTLAPYSSLKSSYKQASTPKNCLALSSSHIFAAQDQKAVVHVYNREKGNLEARIPFNDRIKSLAILGSDDEEETGILVMGMEAGRITLWELATGRITSTSAAHLQTVTHLAVDPTSNWIASASADAVVHIWSFLDLLSCGPPRSATNSPKGLQPVRSFSEHRSPIVALAIGHGYYESNFVVSASEDKILHVWSLCNGDLLQTYLLNARPLCVVLDPADRAVYLGHDDGSISMIEFQVLSTRQRSDIALQVSPKATWDMLGHHGEIGSVNALGVSYHGTTVLSCHVSGIVHAWDVGLGKWKSRVHTHDRPVSNIQMLLPSGLPSHREGGTKLKEVTKPRFDSIGARQASLLTTMQLAGRLKPLSQMLQGQDSSFTDAISSPTIPNALIDEGIAAFRQSNTSHKELDPIAMDGSEAASSIVVDLEKRNGNLLSQLEEAVQGQRKAIKRCMEYEREEWLRRQQVDRKRERKKARRLREMQIREKERKRFMGETVNGNGPDTMMEVPEQDKDLSSDTSEITDTER